ncbi:MAG TPA: HD domain-containing phosphohydrolase [Mariprofundaceae bacterium]|nr:HD domain-containing phosphohydrolase [Mariprofundaceae bacterium]
MTLIRSARWQAGGIRIRLLLMLLVFASLVLVVGADYWLIKKDSADTINEVTRSELTLLAGSLRSNLLNLMTSGADMNRIDESLAALQQEYPEILFLRIVHAPIVTRQYGFHKDEVPHDDLDRQSLAESRTLIVHREERGLDVLRFVYPLKADKSCLRCHEAKIGETLGAFSLTLNTTRSSELKRKHGEKLLIVTAAEILILLFLLFFVLNRLVFMRLDGLYSGAKRMAAGLFDKPIVDSSHDELGVVIQAFNDMSKRLGDLIGEHRAVIDNQSLELSQLMEASEQIGADLPLPDLLHRFANSLTLAAQVTTCRIAMLEDDGETISMKAEHPIRPLPDREAPPCCKEKCPTLWKVIGDKEYMLLHRGDPLSPDEHKLMRMMETQAALCIPIIHRDQVYGIAILMELRSEKREPIDKRKIDICLAMVSQMGAAINIAKLYSRLIEQLMETVLAMAEAVEMKSPWTAGHSQRVTRYAQAIAKELGWSEEQLESLRITGLLHDLGKIGVPGSILNKAGKLTAEEYEVIKRHPEDGAKILSRIGEFKPYIPAIRHHHEWFNGNGYPDGLKGEEIPVVARVLAVADAFDAMTADRPYRKGLDREQAMQRLREAAGEQFDPEAVKAFEACYQGA